MFTWFDTVRQDAGNLIIEKGGKELLRLTPDGYVAPGNPPIGLVASSGKFTATTCNGDGYTDSSVDTYGVPEFKWDYPGNACYNVAPKTGVTVSADKGPSRMYAQGGFRKHENTWDILPGLPIPEGKSPCGIKVYIHRSKDTVGEVQDTILQLLLNGIPAGTNKAALSTPSLWPNNDSEIIELGHEFDLWGLDLVSIPGTTKRNPRDWVNAVEFGFVIAAQTEEPVPQRLEIALIEMEFFYR